MGLRFLSIVVVLTTVCLGGCSSDDSQNKVVNAVDTVLVYDPVVTISSPKSGQTVQEVFEVTIEFPIGLPVHWATVYDTETMNRVSLYDQPYFGFHPGEMTLLISRFAPQVSASFFARVYLTDGDSVASGVITVSNTSPNSNWPTTFGTIQDPTNGDTVYNDFSVVISFPDTLPIRSARVNLPSGRSADYDPSSPGQIVVGTNWWLADTDGSFTATLTGWHGEVLPSSAPVNVHFIKNP